MNDEIPNAMYGIEEAMARMLSKARKVDGRQKRFEISIAPRMKAVGVPQRYRMELLDWNCPKQKKTFDYCRQKFQKVGAIVALVGERGVGKTAIAAQLIRERIDAFMAFYENGQKCSVQGFGHYIKLTDLIAELKPLYSDFGTIEMDRLFAGREAICEHSLLCIDELHECEDQHLKARVLTDILDRRYSNCVDTLLISNEKQDVFRKSIGDSALSRITEHGEIISCVWKSWREQP